MKPRLISKRITALAVLIGTCVLLPYLSALNRGFVNWDSNNTFTKTLISLH
jgi:hypothetical protein